MKLPNFLIIGTAKSGTSSLYHYLVQHPQVFMCFPKEPTFFGHEGESGLFNGPGDNDEHYRTRMITRFGAYAALFRGVKQEKAVGEASIFYLYLRKAPATIKKYVPHATMFAVLRNPADRAYSNYLHLRRQMREPYTFTRALDEERARIANNWNEFWHYKSLGFYYEQVKRYFETFGRQQVNIYLYEDLQKHPLSVMKNIFEILEIDTSFVPDVSRKYNVSFLPKNRAFGKLMSYAARVTVGSKKYLPKTQHWRVRKGLRFIDRAETLNRVPPPPMPEDIRNVLLEDYREDILRLEELLQRDLSSWLISVPGPAQASA
jgi:hypothetical protein